MNIVAVQGMESGVAGAIVWWSLHGDTNVVDLEEAWTCLGGDERYVLAPPSLETALYRAAQSCANTTRELVRPVMRNQAWDFQIERVAADGDDRKLEYTTAVRLRVTRVTDEAGKVLSKHPAIHPTAPEFNALAGKIEGAYAHQRTQLQPADVSGWLLWLLNSHVNAVGLRDRGGFYFVPKDRLPQWRMVVEAVKQASQHQMFEIPAMQAEETVAAVLSAVRKEAEEAMGSIEAALLEDGEMATKSINAAERKLVAVQAKVDSYVQLLGCDLPDLTERNLRLKGALVAARLTTREEAK
jgi:hypothetical protein